MSSTAQRVTGAWLDGDPVGDRRFVDLPGLTLELGDTLPGVRLADALGISSWAAVVGGSMGGQRALEWAVEAPDRVDRMIVLAANTEASADQIAICSIQLDAIRADPHWLGGDYYDDPVGPHVGM